MAEPIPAKTLRKMSRKWRRNYGYDKGKCFVYGLMDGYGSIRYIGQTRNALDVRLKHHRKDCWKSSSTVSLWLRGALDVEIFMIDSNATWDVSEILYIDRYRREGHDLTNILRGGADTFSAAKREGIVKS